MNLPKSGWANCEQRQQTVTIKLENEGMISEILKEVSALENIDDATSKRVLWAQRMEAQRTQNEAVEI